MKYILKEASKKIIDVKELLKNPNILICIKNFFSA